MAGTYQSGNVSATIGTVYTTQTQKTAVCVFNTYTDNTVKTLGTVPASKVWRIVSMGVSVAVNASVSAFEGIIQLNDVDAFGVVGFGMATYGGGSMANATQFDYSAAPVLTAGQTVKLKARSATISTSAHFAYVEEDA